MALGSARLVTEMSTRNFPGSNALPERKAHNFTAICEPTVYEIWEPQHVTTLWASTTCYSDTALLDFLHPTIYLLLSLSSIFICRSLNDTISNSAYIASRDWMTAKNGVERMKKTLPQHMDLGIDII
jgi:hypothetical protein